MLQQESPVQTKTPCNATWPFHDVLRSNLVKNTAGVHKEPNKKYKSHPRTLKSKRYEQCRTKHEYYTSITLKNLSHIHDLLTSELRDYAHLIKFLNMSKT